MEPFKPELDHEWIINLSRAMEEEDSDDEVCEDDHEVVNAVSIFEVPKTLLTSKPEAYTPQAIAIGPYHHRRLELFHMEHHKLHSAKRVQQNFNNELRFHDLVNHIAHHDLRARACYHRYFDFGRERLAWLFAIDASFLLRYLQIYSPVKSCEDSTTTTRVYSKNGAHLIDHTRRKAMHQAILRDIIMLENQMPLFLVRKVHMFYEQENQNQNEKDEIWIRMLMGFCKNIAPIKHFDNQHFRQEYFTKAHLLELLYYTLVPNVPFTEQQILEEPHLSTEGAFVLIFEFICFITCAPLHILIKICRSEVVMLLVTVPWKIIVHIFKLRGKNALNDILSDTQNVVEEAENEVHGKDNSPLVEEITIPRVTELSEMGVKFCPTKGGLSTIKFDKTRGVFHLPIIHLNDNSEVIIRNLVAYEACIGPEAMVFTRYTELMNGIIDIEEDVRILREAGIILNRMKSDKEVATLWNGMTKSVKVTKVPILDKAIDGANAYYSASWKVKLKLSMNKYVYGSWPALTFIAANLMILLSIIETFCSVYQCSKWLGAL